MGRRLYSGSRPLLEDSASNGSPGSDHQVDLLGPPSTSAILVSFFGDLFRFAALSLALFEHASALQLRVDVLERHGHVAASPLRLLFQGEAGHAGHGDDEEAELFAIRVEDFPPFLSGELDFYLAGGKIDGSGGERGGLVGQVGQLGAQEGSVEVSKDALGELSGGRAVYSVELDAEGLQVVDGKRVGQGNVGIEAKHAQEVGFGLH